MKQRIVLTASILLGLALFSLIAGREGSIYSAAKNVWESEAELRVLSDEPAN